MEAVLKTDTAQTWHERLEQAGIPSSLVLNVDDTRKLDQIKIRGMVKDVAGSDRPRLADEVERLGLAGHHDPRRPRSTRTVPPCAPNSPSDASGRPRPANES